MSLGKIREDGIHAYISKTKQNVVYQWTPALNQAIQNARRIKRPVTGLYLFCTRRGQPYSVSGFSSIWHRKMNAAIDKGILSERFSDHDIRAKAASDVDANHATELLAHFDSRTTERHYRRKEKIIKPSF